MTCASLRLGDEDLAAAALRRFLATISMHGLTSPVLLVPAGHREELWSLAGRLGVDPAALERVARTPSPVGAVVARVTLTPREAEVLGQLREASSHAEIAARLGVSSNTVKSQLRSLYGTLGASTRDEALRAAYLQGLLTE